MAAFTKEQLIEEIKNVLVKNFGIDAESITENALIADDLDLDSIDAIDLVAELQRKTGCKFTADDFSSVRTIGDIAAIAVAKMSAEG